jgi:hypothetical protein
VCTKNCAYRQAEILAKLLLREPSFEFLFLHSCAHKQICSSNNIKKKKKVAASIVIMNNNSLASLARDFFPLTDLSYICFFLLGE